MRDHISKGSHHDASFQRNTESLILASRAKPRRGGGAGSRYAYKGSRELGVIRDQIPLRARLHGYENG